MLGDRIRMQGHFLDAGVFIRSLSARGNVGGLARAARDVARLLAAFGKDAIIVETVGVGQNEFDVMRLADTVVVVLVPEAGDTIQAMKAGLLEIADVFVVNKADREGAARMKSELELMLQLRPSAGWQVPVLLTVATDGTGVPELVDADRRAPPLSRRRAARAPRAPPPTATTSSSRALRDELVRRLEGAMRNGGGRAAARADRARRDRPVRGAVPGPRRPPPVRGGAGRARRGASRERAGAPSSSATCTAASTSSTACSTPCSSTRGRHDLLPRRLRRSRSLAARASSSGLVRLRDEGPAACIFLKGNHEDMFLAFLGYDGHYGDAFHWNGGDATLASYGLQGLPGRSGRRAPAAGPPRLSPGAADARLRRPLLLRPCRRASDAAARRPRREEDLLWIREEFIAAPHPFPYTVLYGHTPQRDVRIHLPFKIGLDTGLVYGNRLSCLELSTRELWQIDRGARAVERRSLADQFAAAGLDPP